jgi:hypothetical protein
LEFEARVRLPRQIGHELLLHRRQRFVERFHHGEQTRDLPLMLTGTDAVASSNSGGSSPVRGREPGAAPFVGHIAAGRTSRPTLNDTTAVDVPVPSASSRAIRRRMSFPE